MHANGGGWCLKHAAMNVQGIDYLGALPLKLGKTVASPGCRAEKGFVVCSCYTGSELTISMVSPILPCIDHRCLHVQCHVQLDVTTLLFRSLDLCTIKLVRSILSLPSNGKGVRASDAEMCKQNLAPEIVGGAVRVYRCLAALLLAGGANPSSIPP